jgi:hypothetical protein
LDLIFAYGQDAEVTNPANPVMVPFAPEQLGAAMGAVDLAEADLFLAIRASFHGRFLLT